MGRRIIKQIGGDRIGSGNKMSVSATGYGYSTHDVGKVRRTSMSFGTIVPMGQWMLTTGSRLRINLDALITSNALLYQLYGSAKFQVDVFSARMALYNPKMLLNLNDQGYDIADIKFPQMELVTKGLKEATNISNQQINPSSLLRYLGIAGNGQNFADRAVPVSRQHNAMWLLMYYQIVKEYYSNRQEKTGMMIHNASLTGTVTAVGVNTGGGGATIPQIPGGTLEQLFWNSNLRIDNTEGENFRSWTVELLINNEEGDRWVNVSEMYGQIDTYNNGGVDWQRYLHLKNEYIGNYVKCWRYAEADNLTPTLQEYDLKAIDRMMMRIMSEVETPTALVLNKDTELPYGACLQHEGEDFYAINTTQEGLALGTYQSDVFNNWLDNATINSLTAKNKVKVNAEGEFSIDMLNLTQKLYNYDMRIGVTDGTLDEWREMTYAQIGKSKSLKPVYEGGLSKEIVFDMIISTASTEEDPLGTIASRGNFGGKHKGGYVQIDTDEEKLVMVLAKITPRLVYNQGNDWTTNMKNLDDLHKPALDKIGYQNLVTDQMAAFETVVKSDGSLTTYSAGKQPAWQWYRTNYDDALGNMADMEDYKVFGRTYEATVIGTHYRIKDLTTYIDPTKFNDVFAIQSLDAMNFDVQVGMDATLTLVMSEEVIPNL